MSLKLLVRQGGGAASEVEVTVVSDREGVPIFEPSASLIEMGQRWEQGTSAMGFFKFVDPTAASGLVFRPHASVKLTEDDSGTEYILAWHRIGGGWDRSRPGPGTGGDEIHHDIQMMDCNLDLRGLPFEGGWSRPAETTWERLQALADAKLSGSSSTAPIHRSTTNITVDRFTNDHLVDATSPVDMEANDYPAGTHIDEILTDIMDQWGKGWGITLHHEDGVGTHRCLLIQDMDDLAKFTSAVKISDQLADWDPTHATAPVFEPHWNRARGTTADNDAVISGLISVYGGLDEEPRTVLVETGEAPEDWEVWYDVFHDDLSHTLAPATRRANNILDDRKRPYVTNQPSILMQADQTHLITAGQAIQVKSVVVNQDALKHTYTWRRIAAINWEPVPDGRWWAHLELDRPRNSHPASGGGQPGSTSPKPPPECIPVPDDVVTVLSDSSVGDWGATVTTGSCWGGDPHRSIGGSGQLSPTVAVSAGDIITGTLNFRDETGNDTWEDVDNYNYEGYLQFLGTALPTLSYEIVNQRYHLAGCINVTHHRTETVPSGYSQARVQVASRLGGYQFNGTISEVDPADVPDNDEFCITPGSGGTSPFFVRSDDPRLDADDQHLITKLQQRVINNSGATLQVGYVVVPDTTQDDPSVTYASGASDTDAMVGIVTESGADGETVTVMWSGTFLQPVNITGTPAAGDYLFTSAIDGTADQDPTRAVGAVGRIIAVDATPDTTYVVWWGIPDSATGGGSPASIVTDHGLMGATETFDFADGSDHEGELDANLVVTLTGAVAGEAAWLTLKLTQDVGGGNTIDLPASVVNGTDVETAFDLTASAVNVVTLFSYDGGTSWFAFLAGTGSSSVAALDDLTDVTITSPADADRLRYDGAEWVNSALKWSPTTTFDGTNWLMVVDGGGNPVLTEV